MYVYDAAATRPLRQICDGNLPFLLILVTPKMTNLDKSYSLLKCKLWKF